MKAADEGMTNHRGHGGHRGEEAKAAEQGPGMQDMRATLALLLSGLRDLSGWTSPSHLLTLLPTRLHQDSP